MEEKILNALAEMDQKFEKKFDEMDQKFEKKIDEMNQKFEKKIDEMNQKFEKKFDEMDQKFEKKIAEMDQKFEKKFDEMAQKILDRQFVFEDEYGKKIDAIFEYVQFHQKNNLQRFDRISDLEKRVEETELQVLDHEKRISALERKTI